MIIIKLKGGLGNQMFQYAAAKSLAIKNNCELYLDSSFLDKTKNVNNQYFTGRKFELNIFNKINCEYSIQGKFNSVIFDFFNKFKYVEKKIEFDKSFFEIKKNKIIEGYFNSEKYFKAIKDELYNLFCFPVLDANDPNKKILTEILNSNSISIHVRRSDYLKKENFKIHGTCSLNYYIDAINYFEKQFSNTKYFVFTDDLDWVQENLQSKFVNLKIIDLNNSYDNSWKDMMLMSNCKHNIIANSTFSWWAAWLNKSQDKIVIAPKLWFSDKNYNSNSFDIVPSEWIKL